MRYLLKTRVAAVVVLVSLVALILGGCTGPAGPAGADGKSGVPGTIGATGPEGPPGSAGQNVISGANIVVGSSTVSFPVYVAAVGDALTILGSGFHPGEYVAIQLGGDSVDGGAVIANITGAFQVTTGPISGSPGIFTVTAVGDEGTSVSAPLKIVSRGK